MDIEKTNLKGCFIITPRVFHDDRGSFFESFNKARFEEKTGISVNFVQDNQSISKKGVIRALHYQAGEYAQAKLVRVIRGSVLDVCVDLRRESKTFGKYFSILLDTKHNKQLFIPRGFAHGFYTLEDNTIFSYKCDNYYNSAAERGVIYNDPDLNIDWNLTGDKIKLSDRDKNLPFFKDVFK